MASLEQWANVAEVAGLIALVGGALFAWYQIQEARTARKEASALTVLHSFMRDQEFFEAIKKLMSLPEDWHEDPAVRSISENYQAAERVYSSMEMLGYFVYAGAVQLHHVVDLAGPGIVGTWEHMEGYVAEERATRGPSAFEWFEWLVVQLRTHSRGPGTAVERFSDWTP